MKDEQIIELFNRRDERAINETLQKYSDLCHYVSRSYLPSPEDREECINDAMLVLWNSIPPEKPKSMFAYLSGVIRNIAKSRARDNCTQKRGGGVQVVGEEFLSMLDDGSDLADEFEARRAGNAINSFLESCPEIERNIFVMRFYFNEIYPEISRKTGLSVGNVKMTLSRMRKKLKEYLRKEGFIV